MKKILFFLITASVCFHCFLASAQQAENPEAIHKLYFPSGKLSSEGSMKNGKPDGYWKTYFENGQLKSEGNRKDFKLDGSWKFYSETGILLNDINYAEGRKNGYHNTYYPDGTIKSSENFNKDRRDGDGKYYDERGNLSKQIPYVEGVENGIAKEFGPDGTIITLTTYRNGYINKQEFINRKDKAGLKQGLWKELYSNSQTKWDGNYTDDKKNGTFREFSPDGRVIKREEYLNGEFVKNEERQEDIKLDIKREFYPNGNNKRIGSYYKDVAEGTTRDYSIEGKITSSRIYRKGRVIGEGVVDEEGREQGFWKEFYYCTDNCVDDRGPLKGEGEYKDGKRTGPWKFYYESGKLEQIGSYISGKPDGAWKWYYQNGNIWREEVYKNGKENDYSKEYSDSNTVISEGKYSAGLKEGHWKYKVGEYIAEGEYIEDKEEGLWKQYFNTGKLAFEGTYIEGNENGVHKFYYSNGNIREERSYRMGVREGVWKSFSEDGTQLISVIYLDGREKKIDGTKVPESKGD
jgi:antitoxin component YwqK of YwqJK toxin-antitoxin module